MSTPRPRYLSLAEVGRLTGRHPELLRQWCARRRLPCDRIGGTWALLADYLPLVEAQPARGRRQFSPPAGARRVVVAGTFTDAARGQLVHAELTRRFGLGEADGGLAQLTLDEIDVVLVAARVSPQQLGDAVALMEGLGGRIVADVAEGWRRGASTEAATQRSHSSA